MRRAVLTAAAVAALVAAPASQGEVAQGGGVRVAAGGSLRPQALPRQGRIPVAVALSGQISPTQSGALPQLRRIAIAINAHGRLDYGGLPRCSRDRIQPSTSAEALSICRRSLVGSGEFSSDVLLPEQSPFPSRGRILAFNGRYHGRPAILAHIYGTDPAPASYVLPFTIRRTHGTYGTVLEAALPQLTGDWGFITGVAMTLGRGHGAAGRAYLSAGCPAPAGLRAAVFPLVRTSFDFAGGPSLSTTLRRSCEVER
jgi:hypothetical protein